MIDRHFIDFVRSRKLKHFIIIINNLHVEVKMVIKRTMFQQIIRFRIIYL